MAKKSTILKRCSCRWTLRPSLKIVLVRLVFIGLATQVGASGCSTIADKNKALVSPQPSAQTPNSAKPRQSQAEAIEQNVEIQAFNLQDLSVHEERGQTTLLVRFSQPARKYRHFPLPQPSRIVLDIFGDVKRTTQAETFVIGTSWVGGVRIVSMEETVRLTIDIAGATTPPYTITPEGDGLRIVIGIPDPSATAKKDIILFAGGKRTDVRAASRDTKTATSSPDEALTEEKKYTGQKISLDFKDADIKNVFRLIGEVADQNIIVTDEVTQKVTIRLIEIPWKQALDLIVNLNGLAQEQVGNVIRISTAARIARDKKDQLDARNASKIAEVPQTSYLNVNYAKAKDLVDRAKQIVKTGADIVPDERSNMIIVRGSGKEVQEIVEIVSRLDIRTSQILIESNLIETTPTFARSLGAEVNFTLGSQGDFDSRFLAGPPFVGSLTPSIPPTTVPLPGPGFRFGVFQNRFGPFRDLNYALTAAENEGNIKIISRPSIVTLNNVASTIKSERILRIALPSSTNIASGSGAAAGTAVATEKIPIGINLTVIPQVSSDGFVLLNIKVKSSSVAGSPTVSGGTAGVIPFDELNREAEANVLVRDGETIVIGGILKDTGQESESGIPYLKEIPVLGWLFKNHRWQKDFEELVVFITPRIASAGSENLPTADELWREQMKKTQGEQPTGTP